MKLQAIKRLCVARKRIEIRNTPDNRQWIGNGEAFFLIDDDVHVNENNIAGLFDLDDAMMGKIEIVVTDERDPRFSLEGAPEESDRLRSHFTFWYGDRELRLLRAEGENFKAEANVLIIDTVSLKPAENKDGYMEYRLRPQRTLLGTPLRPLVAVHGSLLCTALVYPESMPFTEEVLVRIRDANFFNPFEGLEGKSYNERDDADAEASEHEDEERAPPVGANRT